MTGDAKPNTFKDRLDDLARRMGSGLLGKIAPVFVAFEVVCGLGLIYLPSDLKLTSLQYAAAGALLYGLIAGFVVVVHPILGNLDGPDATRYLREDSKAKGQKTIPGTARPVANPSPSGGLAQPQGRIK